MYIFRSFSPNMASIFREQLFSLSERQKKNSTITSLALNLIFACYLFYPKVSHFFSRKIKLKTINQPTDLTNISTIVNNLDLSELGLTNPYIKDIPRHIKKLDINGKCLTKGALKDLPPDLEELTIENYPGSTLGMEDLPLGLKKLHLISDEKLGNVNFQHLPPDLELEELKMSCCTRVTNKAIKNLPWKLQVIKVN